MRNFLLTALSILTLSAVPVNGVAQTDTDPYQGYAEEVFMDMEFDANLATPIVGDNEKAAVKKYVKSVAESHKKDLTIDLMRNGEVMIVTFLTDDLFLPNDTLLMNGASKQLKKIEPLLKDPLMYKVVYAVHTDDTGSDAYCDRLATARLNSIYDWLLDAIDRGELQDDLVIVPYSMATSEPLYENDTRQHRRANRRVEFYLVPGPKMIDKARRKTLN